MVRLPNWADRVIKQFSFARARSEHRIKFPNASAEISSDFGTDLRMTRRPTGTIMAPPMPCSALNRIKSTSEVAKPHAAEPKVKTTIAARNTVRAPKRSAIQPLIGMKTASDNSSRVTQPLRKVGSISIQSMRAN